MGGSVIDKTALIGKIKQLEGLTDEEKSNLIGLLRQHKKHGLVWEDKPEDVEERLREQLPVLREVKERRIIGKRHELPKMNHELDHEFVSGNSCSIHGNSCEKTKKL